jgi:Flp pilus assembly protein TadD
MYDDPAARFEECFERAQGFTREQKFDEAIAALDDIPRQYQLRTALLALRCHIHLAAKHWEAAIEIARHLAKVEPDEPAHWISLAWAVRRHESIAAAEKILTAALALHPECATIHYNLACYACQTERLAEARIRLEAAVQLDPASRKLAANDLDLVPLMASLAADDPLREGADS